ncbi:GNAT family N-acetyltransferase [Pseudonocardia sp. KRD-291]|nr:GNAT family N-acetyltransferase [Pseudonocardia sp. KRD291]
MGSAKTGPNQSGPGSHVATASFAVDPATAGRGIGRALGTYVLEHARERGFRAMQFNAVVAANTRAVGLWHSLGFTTVGIVPEAFALPDATFTGLHVMHREL